MDANEYQRLALRTAAEHSSPNDRIHNAVLGLAGEVGEIADAWKKFVYHGHAKQEQALIDELGDVLWYAALMCEGLHITMRQVMTRNIEKLEKRYPDGFSTERSINREGEK